MPEQRERTAGPIEPVTAKGRRTRGRIVDAAADLVYERGLSEVSLDDVRAASGTGRSQLYYYFTDKDDLVHAVIDRQEERVLGVHQPVLQTLSSWDDLEQWRDMIVAGQRAQGCRGGCPLGSLANELAESDDAARAQLSDAFGHWQALLEIGLSSMVDSGVLVDDADTARLALSTIASLQGGLLLAETTRSTYPLEVALDAALAHLRTFGADLPAR